MESIKSHISSTYKESTDLDPLLKEPFANPLPTLLKSLPTKNEVSQQFGYPDFASVPNNVADSINALFAEDMKLFSKRRRLVQNNTNKVFSVIWGQCIPALRAEIKGHTEFEQKHTIRNASWLLQELKKATAGLSRNTNIYVAMYTVMSALYRTKQKPDETLEQYHLRFESAVETIKLSNRSVAIHPCLIDHEQAGNRVIEQHDGVGNVISSNINSIVEDNYLAIAFLLGADQNKYGTLITDLANRCLTGTDNYPVDVPTAYAFLIKYKVHGSQRTNPGDRRTNGRDRRNRGRTQQRGTNRSKVNAGEVNVTMAQLRDSDTPTESENTPASQELVPGRNGVTIPATYCTNCDSKGHAYAYCPHAPMVQGMQIHATLAQVKPKPVKPDTIIPNTWVILDSGSTISSICNPKLLHDVTTLEHLLKVYANDGNHQIYSKTGILNILPLQVYHNTASIANILSLSELCNHFRVTLDLGNDECIHVHVSNHETLRFNQCESGLYYIDLSDSSDKITPYSFFNTVKANKEFFSPREVHQADKSRVLQAKLGRPSTADFKTYIKNNLLINCDITVDDVSRAEAVYGPQVPMLRGKMVRRELNEFTTLPRTPLPTNVSKHHPTDEIDMDFFFVNGNPFFHTKSKIIKFRAVQPQTGRGKIETSNTLKEIIAAFEMSGIKITALNGDNEFEKIRDLMQPIAVHIACREEHIGRIERDVHTIQERCRCYCSALPFKRITKPLQSSLIEEIILCLNDFLGKNGVSKTMSPAAIILGRPKRDCSLLTITPGAYAEIKESTTNSMKYRSTGAIAL